MLLICTLNLSPRCMKTRSNHDRSAGTRPSPCPWCRAIAIQSPALRETTLAEILGGRDARSNKTDSSLDK